MTKIREFLNSMTGVTRVIFETLCAMFVATLTYNITYWISGNVVVSCAVAFASAVFAVAAFASAVFAVAFASAVFAVVTFASAFASVAFASAVFASAAGAASVAFASAVFAVAFAEDYKVRYWKALFVFVAESVLFFVSFFYFIPYFAIALCALCLASVLGIVLKQKIVSYILKNSPSEKPLIQTGYPHRGPHKTDPSFTETPQKAIHRWLYNRFVPQCPVDIDKQLKKLFQDCS